MLIVRVELRDGGRGPGIEIARAAIANVSDLAAVSSYVVIGLDSRGRRIQRVVRNHQRDDGVWPLLGKAFAAGGPSRLPARWARAATLMAHAANIIGPDRRWEPDEAEGKHGHLCDEETGPC